MRSAIGPIGFAAVIAVGCISSNPALGAASGHRGAVHPPEASEQVKADLRQLAVSEEVYLTDALHYGNWHQLRADHTMTPKPFAGEALRIVWYTRESAYCLKGRAAHFTQFYSSTNDMVPAGKGCGHRPVNAKSGGVRKG